MRTTNALIFANLQADLNLRWAHMSDGSFFFFLFFFFSIFTIQLGFLRNTCSKQIL